MADTKARILDSQCQYKIGKADVINAEMTVLT